MYLIGENNTIRTKTKKTVLGPLSKLQIKKTPPIWNSVLWCTKRYTVHEMDFFLFHIAFMRELIGGGGRGGWVGTLCMHSLKTNPRQRE